jgi:hypothetical protein
MKSLKIKLLILNNIKIDLSYMFYECSSLKEFSIIYPKENKQEEKLEEDKEENQTESLKSDDSNSQLNQIYNYTISNEAEKGKKPYNEYKSFNYIKQKYHNIYICKKNDISDFEKIKINRYYISSLNFLRSSFLLNSPEIQNNNMYIDNLNSQYSFESNTSEIIKKYNNTNENNNTYKYFYYHLLHNINSPKINKIIATNLKGMFYECSSLISISGLSQLKTNHLNYMSKMFTKCSSLKEINDIFQLENNNVKDINTLFTVFYQPYEFSSLSFEKKDGFHKFNDKLIIYNDNNSTI